MRNIYLSSIVFCIVLATSSFAAPMPLEGQTLKWLLHLGQNSADRIHWLSGHEFLDNHPTHQPSPGECVNFSDLCCPNNRPATHDLLIWTPQYRENGRFDEDVYGNWFTQYYHIYLYSPSTRPARLHIRLQDSMTIWNNGEKLANERGHWQALHQVHFTLQAGVNSLRFKSMGPASLTPQGDYMSIAITDQNDTAFSDLTFSLEPPLPNTEAHVLRNLPTDYEPGSTINVTLNIQTDPFDTNEIHVIEYLPEGTVVTAAPGAQVVHNTLWWKYPIGDQVPKELQYTLITPPETKSPLAFSGYVYSDKSFKTINGDQAVFDEPQPHPAEVTTNIDTIEIAPDQYEHAEGITIGGEQARDLSGHLLPYGRGLVSGLKADPNGGVAEYKFSINKPGAYHLILEYGELWTMFHHAAPIKASMNGIEQENQLYPTTHAYQFGGTVVYSPHKDPERKALWDIGVWYLQPGQHDLKLIFPPMNTSNRELDPTTDGRPVVTKIILMNYPSLTLPGLTTPHHLDSYEHPPAMLVQERTIKTSTDGSQEITFHGTFHSLSQGNELYAVTPETCPKPGAQASLYSSFHVEPEVFHLPPGGKQDFVFTVCSQGPIPVGHSELVKLWLQGVPSNPIRKPYLFSTTEHYLTLPQWERSNSFWVVGWLSWYINREITDPPNAQLPNPAALGFHNGRYERDLIGYMTDQLQTGKLSSIAAIFDSHQWPYDEAPHIHKKNWDEVWASLVGSAYSHDTTGSRARANTLSFAENLVFYPVKSRWDWPRPGYAPSTLYTTNGFPALMTALRATREQLFSPEEQFRILHNLVLPIFNSYWGEMRVQLTLSQDAKTGDTVLSVTRPDYGKTGSPTDGFGFGTPYIKIDSDAYRTQNVLIDTIELRKPLIRDYPKGTTIVAWPYQEGIELEGMDMMSLVAIAAAGCDPALIDHTMAIYSEILEKQEIMLPDGSFRNEPGSYGSMQPYTQTLLDAKSWFGRDMDSLLSPKLAQQIHQAIINYSQIPFSNGMIPHLNGGGAMNQYEVDSFRETQALESLFPEDTENIERFKRIRQQEVERVQGDIIDNDNFMIPGWGYAMLRSEAGSWDRGMETLLSSKYLLSKPGDHNSSDGLGICLYGLGTILTPRYGYVWMGFVPPFLNQVMIDNDIEGNNYYGNFWHFDGRDELPCAVAHTGDGNDCSLLDHEMSRWCIQFPEYLLDVTFVHSKDGSMHQYDWSHINMGDMKILEPQSLQWNNYPNFLDGYWPEQGSRGAGTRKISSINEGAITAEWNISNHDWVPDGDPTLLRNEPEHSGKLRLTMAANGPVRLIDAQVGYYRKWNGEQTLANSQDILCIQTKTPAHIFVDTMEVIASDEQAHVQDIQIIQQHNAKHLVAKVTTQTGEDWIYLSGQWSTQSPPPMSNSILDTDAKIVVWRMVNGTVERVYLAQGSYAHTSYGHWDFKTVGNHYISKNNLEEK